MNSIVLSSSTIYHDDIYDNHCHSKVHHNTHDGIDNRYCHRKDFHNHRDGFGGSIAAIALVFAAPTAAAAIAAVAVAIAASPESVVW